MKVDKFMRLHAFIHGVVQGVGFRFFVQRKAMEIGLVGYVRNLPNGSVEVVAEGEKGLLLDFVKDLKRGPSLSKVTVVDVNWEEATETFTEFDVRF